MKTRLVLCAAAAGLLLFPAAGCRSQRAGAERARALLRGDNAVRLAAIHEYDHPTGAWRVLFSDPETLRYIEGCMVPGDYRSVKELGGGTTVSLRLKFEDGAEVDVVSYWRRAGFTIFLPGKYAGDGHDSDGYVVFREPMPAGMRREVGEWNLK